MEKLYEQTDEDGDRIYIEYRNDEVGPELYFFGTNGAFLPYAEVIKLHAALGKHIEEQKPTLPRKGAVQFPQSGRVAVWREDIKAWSVTGYERAWGDPGELVRRFGMDWKVLS